MCKPVKLLVLLPALLLVQLVNAQINSPYSRYGLGDLYNSRNVVNKAMGGLATPYADLQSVNFINPASYTNLQTVTFDVGMENEMRTLYNPDRTERSQSNNVIFNYVALGLPIMKDKKGATKWSLALGLRPFTRINYRISTTERLPGIDSVSTLFEGNGGSTRMFIGTAYRIGGLSIGFNSGFLFGNQTINAERNFKNDSVYYLHGQQRDVTYYSRLALDGGIQYKFKLSKNNVLRIGATGFMGGNMNATQDRLRQTIIYNSNNGVDSLDVVERTNGNKGTIVIPSGYTAGMMLEGGGGRWMFGAEYESIGWDKYRFFEQEDKMANSSLFRAGGSFLPDALNGKSYLSRVTYRAGFFTGKDKVVANGIQLPTWGVSFGFGFPIRRYNIYSNQYTSINTSFEFGKRGNSMVPVTESFMRLNVGLCLSDLWFFKRRYD